LSDDATVTRLRKDEDRAFIRSVSPAFCKPLWLDLPDAPLRGIGFDELFTSDELSGSDHTLASQIASSVQQLDPPPCEVFASLGFGSHVDHVIVRCAALQLLRLGFRVTFYEDLPYAAPYSVKTLDVIVRLTARRFGLAFSAARVSLPGFAEFKTSALQCYPSQVSAAWIDDVLEHARKYSGTQGGAERIWRVV